MESQIWALAVNVRATAANGSQTIDDRVLHHLAGKGGLAKAAVLPHDLDGKGLAVLHDLVPCDRGREFVEIVF